MNNIRKALRYIYIYIYRLNLAKAGWAYDRQPREVWKRKQADNNNRDQRGIVNILHNQRRVEPKELRRDIRSGRGIYMRNRRINLNTSGYNRHDIKNDPFIQQVYLSGRRLTSKEVAA